MKNIKKGFAPIILVIIGVIVLGAGSYLLFNKKISPQTQPLVVSQQENSNQQNNITTTTSNFSTTTVNQPDLSKKESVTEPINKNLETEAYVNQKSGFSIHVPRGWKALSNEKEVSYWRADSIFYPKTAQPFFSEGAMVVRSEPFSGTNLDSYLSQINKDDLSHYSDKTDYKELKIETKFTVGGENMYILDDGDFFVLGRGGVTLITLSKGKAYRLIGDPLGPERRKILKESMMTFRPAGITGKVENIQQLMDEGLLAKDAAKFNDNAQDESLKEFFSRIMTDVALYYSEHNNYGIQATTTSINICANGGGVFSDPGVKSDITLLPVFITGTSNVACAASKNYFALTAPLKSGKNLCIATGTLGIKTVTGTVTEKWSTGCSGVLN